MSIKCPGGLYFILRKNHQVYASICFQVLLKYFILNSPTKSASGNSSQVKNTGFRNEVQKPNGKGLAREVSSKAQLLAPLPGPTSSCGKWGFGGLGALPCDFHHSINVRHVT